ncbi:MAG TPA: DUF2282 domain-containing protein [Burkholderiaceae bacterium]
MQTKHIMASALAAALSVGAVSTAMAHEEGKGKEKCYGIAKASANDCANLSGSHSCAGLATSSGSPEEWNYVDKGACKAKGGLSAAEAKAKMKK